MLHGFQAPASVVSDACLKGPYLRDAHCDRRNDETRPGDPDRHPFPAAARPICAHGGATAVRRNQLHHAPLIADVLQLKDRLLKGPGGDSLKVG